MKWPRVLALCSIMASGFFRPRAGIAVAQESAPRQRLEAAQKAAGEGDRFLKLTQDREHGGEVAHSDAIKAELQARERHDSRNAPACIRNWRQI